MQINGKICNNKKKRIINLHIITSFFPKISWEKLTTVHNVAVEDIQKDLIGELQYSFYTDRGPVRVVRLDELFVDALNIVRVFQIAVHNFVNFDF